MTVITKKRRIVLFLVLITISIFFTVSCTHSADNVLYYQRHAATVTGTLTTDTGEFYVKITLSEYDPEPDSAASESGTAPLRDAVIEFTYPEEICGYTMKVFGGNVTFSIGELTVPVSGDAPRRALEIVRLFMIPEGELSTVKKTDDGGVTAVFGDEVKVYVSFDSSSSVPSMIENENGMKLKIDGYFLE